MNPLTSNLGHLLGTGLLDDAESDQVASALGAPTMLGPFGLRTLATSSPRYNPVSYHNGSVWPHDNAIAVRGLRASGRSDVAVRIARGIVDGSRACGGRVPDLWGGDVHFGGQAPLSYPAACRPQAWSAAAAIEIVMLALGLRVDSSRRVVVLHPLPPTVFGRLTLSGVVVAGFSVEIRVDGDGRASISGLPVGWRLEIEHASGEIL